MNYKAIKIERENNIATIILNRPDKLNAIDKEMNDELEHAITQLQEEGIRALILTGAGRGFCSGADLTAGPMTEPENPTLEAVRRIRKPLGWQTFLLHRFPRPTIAAVNGVAAGAGLSFALACDIRIASESARFSAIFVRRAIVADYGCTYLLPRIVGLSSALELMYTGDIIGAREAERIGLVSRVVPDTELMSTAKELAQKLANGPSLTQEMIKRLTYEGLQRTLLDQLQLEESGNNILQDTEDSKEGIRSFLEKREPVYWGR
ncbi:MAG: enoyl-CoA hydratase/isomerase family protein [Chloroflexi bacterium]|nr:enoyl-CoA hydratase/isomerase family protein [Chloroflexota bacterium]